MGESSGPLARSAQRTLVIGAGPVGLVSALLLRRHGFDVEIVDEQLEPATQSRATDIHPRTLARLAASGVTDDLVAAGRVVRRVVVHCGDRRLGAITMGHAGSSHPFVLALPQSTTEAILRRHLSDAGVEVARGTRISDVRPMGGAVEVSREAADGSTDRQTFDWAIACDGAASTVRSSLGIGFPGQTTAYASAIADLEVASPFPADEVHLLLRAGGGLHVLPLHQDGLVRVFLDHWPGRPGEPIDAAHLLQVVQERLGHEPLPTARVRWSSSFAMHRRLAERFRAGRVLLAGDAAHLCPPVGGQGLATGIADAVAWTDAIERVATGADEEPTLAATAAARHRAAARTGWVAWGAAAVNTPPVGLATRLRDLGAPLAFRLGHPLITRWQAGALDP